MDKMLFNEIGIESLQSHEVLFFIRIRGRRSYFKNVYSEKLISEFKSVTTYRCISEYKKDADVHIDLNSLNRDYLYENEYERLIELSSIEGLIKRCRGLRAIPYASATKLINRCFLFFDSYYRLNPELKVIVTGVIDNYVMDLMVRVGESYGIKFIGVAYSFVSPEYKLITVRGEPNNVSLLDSHDVEKFKNKILHNINSCSVPRVKRLVFNVLHFYASYHYRFIVRYLFKHKILGRLEYEYRFAPYLSGFKSLKQLFGLLYLSSDIKRFRESDKKRVYIPLHWYPEATTDYWIESFFHVDYETSVLNTVNELQKQGYEVYAKEHPHFILNRELGFYKKLREHGCHLISPFICAKKVFDNVDLVTVWNGSTGIESLIYGKPTCKVVNSYYGDGIVSDLNQQIPPFGEKGSVEAIADKCIVKVYRSSYKGDWKS